MSAHDSPDLAALWSGVEVVTGALEGDSLHVALNTNLNIKSKINKHLLCINQLKILPLLYADLSVKWFPVEDQRCIWITLLWTEDRSDEVTSVKKKKALTTENVMFPSLTFIINNFILKLHRVKELNYKHMGQ